MRFGIAVAILGLAVNVYRTGRLAYEGQVEQMWWALATSLAFLYLLMVFLRKR